MTKQGNIVSFDELGRGAAAPSQRGVSSQSRSSRRRTSRPQQLPTSASARTRTRDSESSFIDDAAEENQSIETRDARDVKSDRKRRKRNRARADKMYEAQFGKDDMSSTPDDAPRAAVYEGKVGKTQRKVARMIPSRDTAAAAMSSLNPMALVTGITASAKKLVATTILVCVIVSLFSLFGPVQQYYQSVRENDRLQAQYAALQERSDELKATNHTLTSDSGIEQTAHEQFGLIMPGEQTATVEGLSDAAYKEPEAGDNIAANIDVNTIGYPETWYSPVLDIVFGVK